jgi:hypothetical protein
MLKKLVCLALLLSMLCFGQIALVSLYSLPDVTGTGAAVQVFGSTALAVRTFLVVADLGNTNPVRCGGSTTSATVGAKMIPGASWGQWNLATATAPGNTAQVNLYDATSVWCYIATGDKVSLNYSK